MIQKALMQKLLLLFFKVDMMCLSNFLQKIMLISVALCCYQLWIAKLLYAIVSVEY